MPKTFKSFLILLAILAVGTLPLLAKPNFQGDWKLNSAKSDFGQFPPPSSMTQKVAHDEPALKVAVNMSTSNGDFEWESSYTTDGKECVNQMGPSQSKSVLKWDGDTLVIDTKAQFGGNDVTILDKWSLSGDSKVLTVERQWSSSRGEMQQKLVFEKQ